jgi:magnesium-protoporphyrin O-methyltransferase
MTGTPTTPSGGAVTGAERGALPGGYARTRAWLHEYFDRQAAKTWETLTSDAPVSGIRATVRAGRDRMRSLMLSWLPTNLSDVRVLDAGCGTGAASIELARRGASVVAIDLSPTLVEVARQRAAQSTLRGAIDFRAGDMLDPALGSFDYVFAMDSLIHYELPDAVAAIEALAPRVSRGFVFTFAPRTPLLATMHAVGKWFPRADRAPRIVPTAEGALRAALQQALPGFAAVRTQMVKSSFYTSQAMDLQLTPRRIPQ